jgi:hypothetical protein
MVLADVIQRGTRINQPNFANVAEGTLYYVTDEDVLERSSGTAWEQYAPVLIGSGGITISNGTISLNNDAKTRQIGIVLDGGGSVPTTGLKGFKSFPVAGTIISWRLLADQAGDIVFDIWKDTYANFPPTIADTITAAAKPTLSAVQKNESSTLTGWTTAIAAGDVFAFNVDSVATITRVILELTIRITG